MKRGVAAGILVATFVLASAQRSAGNNGGTERPLQQLDIATTISEQQIVREARPQRDQPVEHSGKLGTMQGIAAQGSSLLKELHTSIRQPSTGLGSLSALTEMLDQHHQKMSTQQLEELRAMLRRLRGSKQRQASEELQTSFRQTSISLRREADPVLGRRQAYATSQAYDPVAGAFDKDVLKDRTYSVILYHEPPFVMIKDPPPDPKAKVVDPGNLNQTRTPSNGLLSGFTIDVLESLAVDLGVTLKYYYPCQKNLYENTGSCGSAGQDEALDWLKQGDTNPVMRATYFGDVAEMCGDQILLAAKESQFRCFVAGGVRISAEYYQDFFMTQSMWDTGYALVTLSKPSPTKLMAFAFPFWFETWIVIIAELVIVGICFVYAEGYGTNQCMYTPLDLSTCKGYQVYVWSVLSALWRWSDGLYWAGTICLGAADKAPTTIAGRLLVTVQLFFSLIVMTMYTGGVATFLSETSSGSKVTSFNDYIDKTSGSFDPENTLCVTDSTSVKDFLALQAKLLQKNTGLKSFKTVRGTSMQDCYSKVYKEEAVAALYDHAVALYELSEMKRSGKCGDNGGMCILNQAPAGNVGSGIAGVGDKKSCDAIGHTWIPGTGTLIITGNIMNPFGYGLAFKKVGQNRTFAPTSDYIAFSQGLQFMRDNFKLEALQDQYFSDPDGVPCSADSNDAVQLTFQNVSGLFVICVIVMALGGIIGLVSFVQVTLIKLLPCCSSPKEEEEEIHDGEEDEIDEEEMEKRAEINRKVIVIHERLMKVEGTLGVSSASEENGDGPAPVEPEGIQISGMPSNMFASLGWVFDKPKA
jgi:ABC-type amino acid transport substrate-binding protein